jgi:L-rhamnose mutarotase
MRPMKERFCLTLDLKDDPKLIAAYKRHHEHVWLEIINSIRDSGVEDMEIYLLGTRMFHDYGREGRFFGRSEAEADRANPKVQQWEELISTFQRPLPQAQPGEKWLPMERIFKLKDGAG